MATSNFHNVNANKIYVVEIEEEFDYDDAVENIYHELGLSDTNIKDDHELRSFPSKVIGSLSETVHKYKGIDLEVEIVCVIRSGYYSHANLDWQLTKKICGEEIYDLEYQLEYYYGKSKKHYAKWIEKHLEQISNELVNKVEKTYQDFSTPCGIVARFSNGETIYSKCA